MKTKIGYVSLMCHKLLLQSYFSYCFVACERKEFSQKCVIFTLFCLSSVLFLFKFRLKLKNTMLQKVGVQGLYLVIFKNLHLLIDIAGNLC